MERITGRNARLSDVAERAGVSKATASNVFNRPKLVREEVRARVLAAAKAIGYAGPDPRGRMLSAGKVNAIGVATAEPLAYFFEDPFARAMMVGITEVCDANGIGISLVSAANEDELAWSIRSALVDGLILFCLEDADRLVAAARERRLPFVALAFGDTDDEVSVVGVDDRGRRAPGRAAPGRARAPPLRDPRHGVRRGPCRAAWRMERVEAADYATSRERVKGYFEALEAVGIETGGVPIFETTADPATIDAALEAIFALPEPPTAILAQSDRIAMRALDWLRRPRPGRSGRRLGHRLRRRARGRIERAAAHHRQPADRRARPPRGRGDHRARPRGPARDAGGGAGGAGIDRAALERSPNRQSRFVRSIILDCRDILIIGRFRPIGYRSSGPDPPRAPRRSRGARRGAAPSPRRRG